MNIEEFISFKANFDPEEKRKISEACDVMVKLRNVITDHNCNSIDVGYPDSPICYDLEKINFVISFLSDLGYLHTIFK